jgi:glycosyltransferase involved in cell wall biosynthesis
VRNSYSPGGLYSAKRAHRFASVCRTADVVIAGNAYLRDEAALWTRRTEVIPTCVDPARYRLAEHGRAGSGVQLAWIGSSSTLQGLETVRPMLEGLGRAIRGLRLKIICNRFLRLDHLPVVARRWSEATEAADLAAADIGISWLPDDLWSRGKCGLKILQYMAAGLPVVANPVGLQASLVRHGETGFLARTPGEWTEAIRRLAEEPDLRRRMGLTGRFSIEKEFNHARGAARWETILRGLAQRRTAAW